MEFGLLLSASDAVFLGDNRALGSMTLHAAVGANRPVISPACPAVSELASLGGAIEIEGPVTRNTLHSAFQQLDSLDVNSALDRFRCLHDELQAVSSLLSVYREAGLPLP